MRTGQQTSVMDVLAANGIMLDEPNPNAWLLKAVPCQTSCFNKLKTNLLILRTPEGNASAFVDEDLIYTGSDPRYAAAFTSDVSQGWRRLLVLPAAHDRMVLLDRILRECLQSPVFQRLASQSASSGRNGRATQETNRFGPAMRMAARVLDPETLPPLESVLYEDTIDRIVSVWRRSAGGQVPILWGLNPRRQADLLRAAAQQIAFESLSPYIVDVCCPVLAAGCTSPAQLDGMLNQFLAEAREPSPGILILRELESIVSASHTAAAILVDAVSTWNVQLIGGVGDRRGLDRVGNSHQDIRSTLVPIRVTPPTVFAIKKAVAELFVQSGVDDAGGLTLQAIMGGLRKNGVDAATALGIAARLIAEAKHRIPCSVFPDDVGTLTGGYWHECDALSEDNNTKEGDSYGTASET